DFQAQGIVDSLGTRYQLFTAANAKAGQQVSLQLTGLPEAGEKSYLDARAVMILAATLGLISTKASLGATRMESADSADCDELLRALLALERAHKAGKVSDKDFQRQDRALRLRLRATLGHEQAAMRSGASGVGVASAESDPEAAASVMETPDESAAQAAQEATTEQSGGGRL